MLLSCLFVSLLRGEFKIFWNYGLKLPNEERAKMGMACVSNRKGWQICAEENEQLNSNTGLG